MLEICDSAFVSLGLFISSITQESCRWIIVKILDSSCMVSRNSCLDIEDILA